MNIFKTKISKFVIKFVIQNFLAVLLLVLVCVGAYVEYQSNKILVGKFNGAAAIRAAGYTTEGGVSIAPCHGKQPFTECGPNDEYIVGFVTTLDGIRREGYVTIREKTSTTSKVTFWPIKHGGE